MSEKTDVMITPQRRRPTGAPPPLPHPVSVTTRAWLVLAVVVLAGGIVISVRAPSLRLDNQVNSAVLRLFARARTPWLTGVAHGISAVGSGWEVTVAGLSAVVLTITFRRWRAAEKTGAVQGGGGVAVDVGAGVQPQPAEQPLLVLGEVRVGQVERGGHRQVLGGHQFQPVPG
jgi:hypothetical protein